MTSSATFPIAAEPSLAASHADVLRAIDALRVGLAVFDGDERLRWCNSQFRYTYLSLQLADNLIGMTLEEILRLQLENGEIAGEVAAREPNGGWPRCWPFTVKAVTTRLNSGWLMAGGFR